MGRWSTGSSTAPFDRPPDEARSDEEIELVPGGDFTGVLGEIWTAQETEAPAQG